MNADAVIGWGIFAAALAWFMWELCRKQPEPQQVTTLDEHYVDVLCVIAEGCGDFAQWDAEVSA
jgi:hypothetical protein